MKNPLSLYLLCALCGLLGQLFHLFVIKLPAEKKRAKAGNVPFSIGAYFKEDWLAVGANLIAIVIFVVLLDELIGYNPSLLRWIKFGYIGLGFMGSSALIAWLGKFSNQVQSIVNIKTDQLDELKAGERL